MGPGSLGDTLMTRVEAGLWRHTLVPGRRDEYIIDPPSFHIWACDADGVKGPVFDLPVEWVLHPAGAPQMKPMATPSHSFEPLANRTLRC